ncbi:unnamed protein product [Prorocentrum cordatum]|uniref:Protein kinase domain-containing protein n=1 Tax=Prorocentrum cordatum TaxID=2364126 RepID=A0ABN9T3M0_9DINO|nr:unnamed protein product [Polarella glacialis]
MIQGKGHDHTLDNWSLGVLLYEMCVGRPPFQSTNHVLLISKILSKEFNFPAFVPNPVIELVSGLLQHEPRDRMSIDSVLQHQWLITRASVAEPPAALDKHVIHEHSSSAPVPENVPAPGISAVQKSLREAQAKAVAQPHSPNVHGATLPGQDAQHEMPCAAPPPSAPGTREPNRKQPPSSVVPTRALLEGTPRLEQSSMQRQRSPSASATPSPPAPPRGPVPPRRTGAASMTLPMPSRAGPEQAAQQEAQRVLTATTRVPSPARTPLQSTPFRRIAAPQPAVTPLGAGQPGHAAQGAMPGAAAGGGMWQAASGPGSASGFQRLAVPTGVATEPAFAAAVQARRGSPARPAGATAQLLATPAARTRCCSGSPATLSAGLVPSAAAVPRQAPAAQQGRLPTEAPPQLPGRGCWPALGHPGAQAQQLACAARGVEAVAPMLAGCAAFQGPVVQTMMSSTLAHVAAACGVNYCGGHAVRAGGVISVGSPLHLLPHAASCAGC